MSSKAQNTDNTPARSSLPRQPESPDLGRHARKCCICRHPNRCAIEKAFLQWHSPDAIADEYDLYDRKSIYRHAHATGLWARRKRNLRFVLERVLEHAEKVTLTAGDIVSAVRAYTHINDAGEWVEPPGSPLVTHHSSPFSNRPAEEVENEPTR